MWWTSNAPDERVRAKQDNEHECDSNYLGWRLEEKECSSAKKCAKFHESQIREEEATTTTTPEFSQFHFEEQQSEEEAEKVKMQPQQMRLELKQEQEQELEKRIKINHREFKRKHQHQHQHQNHLQMRISTLKPMLIYNNLLSLFIFNAIFSHLINITPTSFKEYSPTLSRLAQPSILLADAIECAQDSDCRIPDKICHENKCICGRDRPIEDQDRCLSQALVGEQCLVNEQCLGNSLCVEATCSCGSEAIPIYNPSSRIDYCHPKRRLNEECNYDPQCPANSYCSMNKNGCLCQNGYAPSLTSILGIESLECLPKTCSNSSTCESEFHACDDNKCKCLASHFDPTSAKCYKFGSMGGKLLGNDQQDSANGNLTATKIVGTDDDNNFYSILKDLTENGDKLWLVLIILISLSLILFVLVFLLIRKHYLGFCWTAHKKEYEPNTKNPPRDGYFSKNTINNKSFRKKNNTEVEDEADEANGDDGCDEHAAASSVRSNLVTNSDKQMNNNNNNNRTDGYKKNKQQTAATAMTSGVDKNHSYVKVNINEIVGGGVDPPSNHHPLDNNSKQYYQHQIIGPLKSSTSTPV